MKWKFGQGLIQACLLGSCFLVNVAHADVNNSGATLSWGYKGNNGPERWAQIDTAFAQCGKGKSQSPISLGKKVNKIPGNLVIDYHPAAVAIENNGQTNLMIGNSQMIINDGHSMQINFPTNKNAETIKFNGVTYRLVQLHLHSPSENELHGQDFPLEIHFVHQGDDGKVAVIGVFVKGGSANATLGKIIQQFPNDKGVAHPIVGEQINPLDLLPKKRDYYSFMGSLTTPPCTEGLQWIVMSDTITASPAQILLFRKAMGGNNARPVQPINKRVINFSTMN